VTGDLRATVDIGDATTVLLLAPDLQEQSTDACMAVLDGLGERVDRVVPVTVTHDASEWLSLWEREVDDGPAVAACVNVDRTTRSTVETVDEPVVPVERVSDPTDLETIGRRVSDALQRADEAGDSVGVAVHSLTGLLEHVDEPTGFKFVYTLGEVARRVDGVVVFHLDPNAHDDETVETFRIVCEAVVDATHGRSRSVDR